MNKWHDLKKNPEDLPPNATQLGTLCPRYDVMTKFGRTVGWFNPDFDSWFVLVWLISHQEPVIAIDFKRGDIPKVLRCRNGSKEVIAWREIDEYKEET